jgi:predicted phosphohydrolase
MRVFAIADLHLSINNPKPMDIFGEAWAGYMEKIEDSWRRQVGDDDVVLLAGDFSWAMKFDDALTDLEYIAKLPGKKVLVRGNHDYWWKSITNMRNEFPKSIFAVQNDCLRFGSVLVSGTRLWTVPEAGKAQNDEDKKIFLREHERLKLSLAAMKNLRKDGDTVIVMTHFPPHNANMQQSVFMSAMEEAGVDICVYGHLHGKKARLEKSFLKNGIKYYLTACDFLQNELLQIL